VAVYKTQSKQLLDNYAVLQTLEPTEIVVGQQITVGSLGAPFDGTFTVLDVPLYEFIGIDGDSGALLFDANTPRENQVLFACTGADVEYTVIFTGTVTYTQVCTWVNAAQLETYLGVDITDPSDDFTLLGQAASAGCQFAYRRRQESGYADSLSVPRLEVTPPWARSCTRQPCGVVEAAHKTRLQPLTAWAKPT
jgi:hypothetical protein